MAQGEGTFREDSVWFVCLFWLLFRGHSLATPRKEGIVIAGTLDIVRGGGMGFDEGVM